MTLISCNTGSFPLLTAAPPLSGDTTNLSPYNSFQLSSAFATLKPFAPFVSRRAHPLFAYEPEELFETRFVTVNQARIPLRLPPLIHDLPQEDSPLPEYCEWKSSLQAISQTIFSYESAYQVLKKAIDHMRWLRLQDIDFALLAMKMAIENWLGNDDYALCLQGHKKSDGYFAERLIEMGLKPPKYCLLAEGEDVWLIDNPQQRLKLTPDLLPEKILMVDDIMYSGASIADKLNALIKKCNIDLSRVFVGTMGVSNNGIKNLTAYAKTSEKGLGGVFAMFFVPLVREIFTESEIRILQHLLDQLNNCHDDATEIARLSKVLTGLATRIPDNFVEIFVDRDNPRGHMRRPHYLIKNFTPPYHEFGYKPEHLLKVPHVLP